MVRFGFLLVVALLAACGSAASPPQLTSTNVVVPSLPSGGASPEGSSPSAAPSGSATSLVYAALGDSWPEGAHCGGCRTFADQFADGLAALTGRSVDYIDLNGDRSRDSATVLESLRSDSDYRAKVASADVILIATGPNEMGPAFDPSKAGTCGGKDNADCIRALGKTWRTNFDAIAAEIRSLRGGRPTAIRFVDAANAFVSVPEMTEGMPAGFATGNGALIFAQLRDAMCGAAKDAGGICVDIMPILNGPHLDKRTDENSPENHRAIADALIRVGLPELTNGSSLPGASKAMESV